MLPHARILHRMPGRVRLRIASRRRDTEFFQQLKTALEAHEAIELVTVNPVTGTVLILGPGADADIAALAEERNLFRIPPSEPSQDAAQIALQAASRLDERLRAATHGRINAPALIFLGFAAAGAYQILKREILPPAATLLWYAFEVARYRRHPTP